MGNYRKTDINRKKPASYRYDVTLPVESAMLEDLLKATEIQQLFESFYNLITIPVAIIDLNANVLFSSPWQRICTQFHRVNPTTCARCIESDTQLALRLKEGQSYTIYSCRNGLTDCASPIIIEGKHVANLFIGQFLTEEPDEDLFRRQAEEFGFNVDDYLAALHEVPIVSAEKIPAILDMLAHMTCVTTNLGIDRKCAIENQARQSIILNTIPQSVFWKDLQGRYLGCNVPFAKATGLNTPDDIIGKTDFDLPWPRQEAEAYRADDQAVISANQPRLHIIEPVQQADGKRIVVDTSKIPLVDARKVPYGVVGIYEDITERKEAQEALIQSERKFGTIFRDNPVPLAVSEFETGRFIEVNNALLEMMHGTSLSQMIGRTSIEIGMVTIEERKKIVEAVRTFGRANRLGISMTRLDGERFVSEITSSSYELAGKRYLLTCLIDITERIQAEEKLKKAAEEWQTTFDSTTDLFFLIDRDFRITKVNKTTSKFLNLPMEQVVGRHCYELMHGSKEPIPECPLSRLQRTMKHEESELYLEAQDMWVQVTVDPVLNEREELLCVVHIVRDITSRKKAEERIEYLAYYDAMTGLPNRNLFLDTIDEAIAQSGSTSKSIAVLLMNVNRFKAINDVYGTEAGDRVLKELAGRLSISAPGGNIVARLSTREFGIALLDVAGSEDVIPALEKIQKDISYPFTVDEDEIVLTFSTGISVFPQDGHDAREMLKSSGLALRKATEAGRNTYQFYTEDMNVKASEFVLLEKQISTALQEEEFILYYQPYWDMNTHIMVGMEALIRWQSKGQGLISPGRFIPVLEDTGMIIEVGEWILQTALKQVKGWQDKGYPAVPVSVNLSLIQFRQKELADVVKRVVKESGVHPSLLTLEITESAFMQDLEFTNSVLKILKDIGCSVSIDDFGTGYSSLSYLKKFPIDNLKIDISFIRESTVDPDTASIVTAIINMAHTLNLKTIAEGIETEEQRKFLRLLRCDMGQGFFLSRPLPATEVQKHFVSAAR